LDSADSRDNKMGTIGEILGDARQNSGLSIEDVAHETRIQPATIRCIEEGDFSKFPSVAYAKSFIRKYAEFLEVDVSSALKALNSGVTVRLGDNELMDEMKRTIKKDRRFRLEKSPKTVRRKLDKPGSAPILLNLILTALLTALAVFYFLGFNTNNAEEAKQEITRGLQKANPFADESEAEPSGKSGGSSTVASVDPAGPASENPGPQNAVTAEPASTEANAGENDNVARAR